MTVPVFELGSTALGVQDSEGPAEVPERPARVQFVEHVERVVKPSQHDMWRCVLIGTHFPEVDKNPVARQNLSVVKYFPLDTLLCSTENETCRFGVSMER